jgi:hypothetical protein
LIACIYIIHGSRILKPAEDKGWSPYLAGSLSGLLIVLSVLVSGMYFGTSTSFVRTAGMIERLFSPDKVATMEYFARYSPKVDWQWMFVLGILLGAFVSSITSGSFRLKAVPDMWRGRFGTGVPKRVVVAFLGGLVSMFGARLSGG